MNFLQVANHIFSVFLRLIHNLKQCCFTVLFFLHHITGAGDFRLQEYRWKIAIPGNLILKQNSIEK